MSDELRQRAEAELAKIPPGRVTDRERYLEAIMRRLEREQASHPTASTAAAQNVIHARNDDKRPSCPVCDGNGWVESGKRGGYSFVSRCPDCDHGKVTVRSAAEPRSTPEVAKAHLRQIRASLGRMAEKQNVRDL